MFFNKGEKMHQKHAACFLDFDHTIFHTDQFFHVDARNSFLNLGIDALCWEQAYAAVRPTGYTIKKHLEAIIRQSGTHLPLGKMQNMLQTKFSDLKKYLFPDVIPFLHSAKEKGISLYLLSFGDAQWQSYKVAHCGINDYFDDIIFTAREGAKADVVKEKTKKVGRVIVVDNDPRELDAIKDITPQTHTWCINRVPDELLVPHDESSRLKFFSARTYAAMIGRHQHDSTKTLDEVLVAI